MIVMTVIAVAVALGIGFLTKLWLDRRERQFASNRYSSYYSRYRVPHLISWGEFVVVSVVLSAIAAPLLSNFGTWLSTQEQLRYKQWLNGVEIAAIDNVTDCKAGHAGSDDSAGRSNCQYTYVSGTYSWSWTETRTTCTTDSKGNQDCTTDIIVHHETSNIYTPFATREHTYGIRSWMHNGDGGQMSYTFPGAYLDANPTPHPKSTRDIPSNIPRGAPADWAEAKARLDAGDPRAVTKEGEYDNYILASGDEVLKTFGPRLDDYKERGLLPDQTANILSDPITGPSRSQADKVSFVGYDPGNKTLWQKSVMRFNAALGTQLQGDLHVVLVDSSLVLWSDAVPYTQSLKAYWQSDVFGRRAIAKNAIILVMGVDTATSTVAWADASTGMPFGNELMIQYLRDELPGKVLLPDVIFGTPRTVFSDGKANTTHTAPSMGVVESIVFDKATFKRFSMSCKNDSCVGYGDLVGKIQPTTAAIVWVFIATIVVSIGLWLVVGFSSFVDNGISWCLDNVLPHRGNRRERNNDQKDW